MGKCIYCGQNAGFFHSVHEDCQSKHDEEIKATNEAKAEIAELSKSAILSVAAANLNAELIKARTQELAIDNDVVAKIVGKELSQATKLLLIQDELNTEIFHALEDFLEGLGIEIASEYMYEIKQSYFKTLILKNMDLGNLPDTFSPERYTPSINLGKTEKLIWKFEAVSFFEDRIHTTRVGGGAGLSIKLHKGVYMHTGGFASHSVSSEHRDFVDKGEVLFSTKNIYFVGQSKGFKHSYSKIIKFDAYSDGLGLIRDGATAKYQVLETDDAWFMYNIAVRASQL